jgi:hypothetical protein
VCRRWHVKRTLPSTYKCRAKYNCLSEICFKQICRTENKKKNEVKLFSRIHPFLDIKYSYDVPQLKGCVTDSATAQLPHPRRYAIYEKLLKLGVHKL